MKIAAGHGIVFLVLFGRPELSFLFHDLSSLLKRDERTMILSGSPLSLASLRACVAYLSIVLAAIPRVRRRKAANRSNTVKIISWG